MADLLPSRFETYLLDEEVEKETETSDLEKREEYLPLEQPQYPQGFFSSL
ncbi:hypothetical protein [Lysinibacillus odysseyi]|nr:hypothetical protein [Lysinibacillus odysseyi]